jgi:hypothetical protein
MRNWSRSERIALISCMLTGLGTLAAIIVVPEIRRVSGLLTDDAPAAVQAEFEDVTSAWDETPDRHVPAAGSGFIRVYPAFSFRLVGCQTYPYGRSVFTQCSMEIRNRLGDDLSVVLYPTRSAAVLDDGTDSRGVEGQIASNFGRGSVRKTMSAHISATASVGFDDMPSPGKDLQRLRIVLRVDRLTYLLDFRDVPCLPGPRD